MERSRFKVEPVRLKRCSFRLWGGFYDSGIAEHDVQGQRCHEVGKGLRAPKELRQLS